MLQSLQQASTIDDQHDASDTQTARRAAPVTKPPVLNALTIDVEDYFHVSAFADHVNPSQWDGYESRVVQNTRRLLRLLETHDVTATFYILGWVARKFPEIVREIQADGHEIGCHSYWHRLVYQLTPEEFRDDLVLGRSVLEDVLGEPVRLYRAPSFSIVRSSLWALEILADEGFEYDSSIFPIYHDRYGLPGADLFPHSIDTPSGCIHEFPGSAYRRCGVTVPVSGGGYFRLFPSWFTNACLSGINHRHGQPFMFYLHPWEIDPDQPRLGGPLRSRFRHYQNLASTERKLQDLLQRHRFGPLGRSFQQTAEFHDVPVRNVESLKREPLRHFRLSRFETKRSRRRSGITSATSKSRQILLITHRVPYPPNRGDRIRTFNFLKYLSRYGDVSLACLADEKPDADALEKLNHYCQRVAVVPVEPYFRWVRAGLSMARGRTVTEGAFTSPWLKQIVRRWAADVDFDLALASSSALGQYLRLPELGPVPTFIDLIDVDSRKWKDYAKASPPPARWVYEYEARRLQNLERDQADWNEGLMVVSEPEANIYREFHPDGPIHVVSNGVDIDYFHPDAGFSSANQRDCVFVGALDYKPNIDGVRWFCNHVWPRITAGQPGVRLKLVGREPAREVQELGRIDGVDVVGTVPDVRPFLKEAAVAVVPLLIARGVQNKVLEALAMGKAVVASPDPLVGLHIEPGVHLLSASTPDEWVRSVLELLDNPDRRGELGLAGTAYVTAHHRWDRCLHPLAQVLELNDTC